MSLQLYLLIVGSTILLPFPLPTLAELLISSNGSVFNSTDANLNEYDDTDSVLPRALPSPPLHYPEYSEFINTYSEIDVKIRFESNGAIVPELFPMVVVNRTVLIDALVERRNEFSILNFTWMIDENCFDTGSHSRFRYHFTVPAEYNVVVMAHGLNQLHNNRHYFGLALRMLNVQPLDGQYQIVGQHQHYQGGGNSKRREMDSEEKAKIDAILASYVKHSTKPESSDPNPKTETGSHWTGFNVFLSLLVMAMFSLVVVLFVFIVQYSDRYNRTRMRIRRLMQFYSLDGASTNSNDNNTVTATYNNQQSLLSQNTSLQYLNKSQILPQQQQHQPFKSPSIGQPLHYQQRQQQLEKKEIIEELLQDTIQSSYESAIVRIGQSVVRPQTLVKTTTLTPTTLVPSGTSAVVVTPLTGSQRDEYEHLSDYSD